jgi:arginyl-tRNA synthetase
MKSIIISILSKETKLPKEEITKLIEIPPNPNLGDFAFPCFQLAKQYKKAPQIIAMELKAKLDKKLPKDIEKIEANNAYINFFINKESFAEQNIRRILKEKENYGRSKEGKGRSIVFEFSSPNIAKPFGIGHLRSTIIGNALANIAEFQGYKTIRLNYFGDWGTPFGKLLVGWERFRNESEFKRNPVKHLYNLYVRVSSMPELDGEARKAFEKLEKGDERCLQLWRRFKEASIKDFNEIYKLLNIKFNVVSGESEYNKQMAGIIKLLKDKGLIEKSEGAEIVNLERYNLGICLIQKSDGTTLYATRDLAAAIDRAKKYKFSKMIYETGAEQQLHFKQVFKILELLGFRWAKACIHADHGLYLDKDGRKFSTRMGKTIFMQDVLEETINLAKAELRKRSPQLKEKEINKRSLLIARSAILYGDLKNFRQNNIVFDIERFVSFEGNTGPYLQYSYARASSILKKVRHKKKSLKTKELSSYEIELIKYLSVFPDILQSSCQQLNPALIANYAYELSQLFNEFYHNCHVVGSKQEAFRIALVVCFKLTLKNALNILGIDALEEM